MFPGKKDEKDPDKLSEEDLPDKYLETRVTDIEDYRDPERDLLTEYMEKTDKEWED